ncbi:MAG: oxidoreductase family protein [Thermodesulfobacteriota bacterium]
MSNKDPENIADVTIDWLSERLAESSLLSRSYITKFYIEDIAEGRAWLSSVVRVKLEYDSNPDELPYSFVIKLSQSKDNRSKEYEVEAYKREINFYEQIAPSLPMRLPKLYYSNHKNLMILEDLSFLKPGDQLEGIDNEKKFITLEALAKLHAAYWNRNELNQYEWLPDTNNVEKDFDNNWDSFVDLCGYFIDPKALRIGEKLKGNTRWLIQEISKKPQTLAHDDMKLDNLLFGEPKTSEAVVILDWQFVIKSMGTIDVARFIGGGLNPDQRAGHQIEYLRFWYDKLVENGVSNYSWEDAQGDFQLAALYCLLFPVKFHKGISSAKGRALEYIQSLYSGLFLLAEEVDAGSMLK